MKLPKDSFDFIYDTLVDFAIANDDMLTGFERKWLTSIREQFATCYKLIKERCD